MLLVHVLDKLNLHLLFYSIKTDGLISGVSKLFGLGFNVLILFFDSFFETFHVIFDSINVLDSLLSCGTRNVRKNLLNFKIFKFEFVNLM